MQPQNNIDIAIGIFFLSVFVEGFVKYIFDVLSGVEDDTKIAPSPRFIKIKPYTHFVALVLGVGLALAYRIDIPSLFGLTATHTIVGYVVSGVIIGRGSNYFNDIISKVRGAKTLTQ